MTGLFPQVPLDDPALDRYEQVHALDKDVPSTNMAIMIAQQALAAGHPENPDAATQALTGPAASAGIQTTLKPYFDTAINHDTVAEEHSAEAVEFAQDSLNIAQQRSDLPEEPVQLSHGPSRTRGQVQTSHDECLVQAAQRESRGDFEHHATQPGLAIRLLIVPVLAVIEVFLLIWPVTNASWADPKSVAYAVGLVAMFLVGNELLPKWTGITTREAREADHATKELTQVSISAGQGGDRDKGRQAAGQVDERHTAHTKRRRTAFRAGLGIVLMIYAAVMFTRVVRLAEGLNWPLPLVLLAAALITVFTAGAPIVLAWWWSRGNKLGDQLREYGAITDESRMLALQLGDHSREQARASGAAVQEAQRHLDLGEQAIYDGEHVVYVGMQKAAAILGQKSVLLPNPENLHSPGRAIRDGAAENLRRAASILTEAQRILDADPFPDSHAPNPWELRIEPRHALPNQANIHPSQLSILHVEDTTALRRWRDPRLLGVVLGVVVLAVLAAALIMLS